MPNSDVFTVRLYAPDGTSTPLKDFYNVEFALSWAVLYGRQHGLAEQQRLRPTERLILEGGQYLLIEKDDRVSKPPYNPCYVDDYIIGRAVEELQRGATVTLGAITVEGEGTRAQRRETRRKAIQRIQTDLLASGLALERGVNPMGQHCLVAVPKDAKVAVFSTFAIARLWETN